jgi:CLIP-associating protein 1/2
VFSALLRIRFSNQVNVLEATNTLRDALTSRVEPVYGLTTFHGALRAFQSEPLPEVLSADAKASSFAFGLIALGRFILRLPAEILEDELPRLKATLISVRSISPITFVLLLLTALELCRR